MSRDIAPKTSVTITEQEAKERTTEQGKLIFTTYKGHDCALLLRGNRILAASLSREGFLAASGSGGKIGAVYIGKIKNIVKNIDACFVEIADDEICFLSMKNAVAPYLLNRTYDGRLLEGDELLVQVEREAQKTKQASVTAHITLANDYFALSFGSTKVGYSAKLSEEAKNRIGFLFTEHAIFSGGCLIQDVVALLSGPEYDRIKKETVRPESLTLPSVGCIVRTKAGDTCDADVLFGHFFDLTAKLIRLLHIALHRSCFSCVMEAPAAIENVLGQLAAGEEYQEIVTDREDIFREIQKMIPQCHGLRLYQDKLLPLSKLYSVESKLETALERRVWLKSGGYLIIEHTEALTAIDVNSGKYEARKGSGETYLKINLEAAEEIALQLRLRNLSGIIVVDFINMRVEEERRSLLNRMRELVKSDRVKTAVVDITALGLMEITRKKINKPLAEQWRDCQR